MTQHDHAADQAELDAADAAEGEFEGPAVPQGGFASLRAEGPRQRAQRLDREARAAKAAARAARQG